MEFINLADYEIAAKQKLPQMAFDYYASGACDQITLYQNQQAYRQIFLKNRVLQDVSQCDLTTTLFGEKIAIPILIAPAAFQAMADPEGEIATAKGANACQTIMTLSTLSNKPVEEVVKATAFPVWFQLYVYKDRKATHDLIQRAELAGCKALVFTVDAPYLGKRDADMRNLFALPAGLIAANMEAAGAGEVSRKLGTSGLMEYFIQKIDPALTWQDIDWLKSITTLPIILKGIGCAEDAKLAVECGVDGIIVSNHGGRQLDTVRSTIRVLPEVVEAVEDRLPVLIDGGIRRGTDVLKALALGAKAVLIGRPILWALAVNGSQGVQNVLTILKKELRLAMALTGCRTLAEINRNLIAPS